MEWLVWIGVASLVSYELYAAITNHNRTISEWFWDRFRARPWTRWATLGILVVFTLHIIFRLWGY